MKLLLKREQSRTEGVSLLPLRFGGGILFKLQASLELDQEEKDLVRKYSLGSAALVASNTGEDLRNAAKPAAILGVIAAAVAWFFWGIDIGLLLGGGVFCVLTFIYYKHLREEIILRDLLGNGRAFWCDSVVTLVKKEDELANMSHFLRQVLESSKTWDEREAIDIEALGPEELKQAILRVAA